MTLIIFWFPFFIWSDFRFEISAIRRKRKILEESQKSTKQEKCWIVLDKSFFYYIPAFYLLVLLFSRYTRYMKRRRNKEASNFATYSSALSTLWTSTRFFFPFSVCYFFITFLLLWELWSKTWAFSISIILRKFFFSVRFSFLFDSLFIFLQFIEKVSVFTWNLWGKILVFHEFPWSFQSFHQAKPAPGTSLASKTFHSFHLILKRLKGCFCGWLRKRTHCKWMF